MFTSHRHAILTCMLLWALTACSINPVTGKADLSLISEQQEIQIGRDSHPAILKRYPRYANEALQTYVNRIGQKLAANSHRSNLIYRFTLLDSKEINAFALPGGYIYITRGLLAYLNSEAELAAVLGHEIGHVTARHSVQQISAAKASQLGYQLGALLIPQMRTQQASQLFGLLGNALIRGYGRDHELEADRLGAEYLVKSGYPASAMIEVIKILKNQEIFEQQLAREEQRQPNVYHGVFSTHPDNDTRLHNIISEVSLTTDTASDTPAQDRHFLRRLEGLTLGDSEAQGILRKNHFYHKTMNFALTFPENWRIDNRSNGLLATSPDGQARFLVVIEDLNLRLSPLEFIRKRLHIKSTQNNQPLLINGLRAYTLQTRTNTGQYKRVTVILYRDQAYIFIGLTKDLQHSIHYDSAFLEVAHSFHALRPEEKKLASAKTLHLINNPQYGTLDRFIDHALFPHHGKEKLELLNNLYPNRAAEPERLLKIVQ